MYFIENRGQVGGGVAYYVEGRGTAVYFTPDGVTYALTGRQEGASSEAAARRVSYEDGAAGLSRWAVKLDFVGANCGVSIEGGEKTPAVVSYFKGPASENQTGLPTFQAVTYRNLWPGIDVSYSGTTNRLKYQFVVQPGADPQRIRLAYRGADIALNETTGQLEVATPVGGFRDDKPYVFQQRGGREIAVPAAYRLEASDSGHTAYTFALGDYDPNLPLVIDPSVLIYAGYIGGTSFDTGNDVAVDANGNAYVTGETAGTAGFPTAAGPDLTFNGETDAFVAKVNAAGTALVYAGYIGGDEADAGESIAVDAAGNAYITGKTSSPATSFPAATGPDLTFNGASDAFVAKINAAGTALMYAGYIGGNAVDGGLGIAVDAGGNAYVTGETLSNEFSFPVVVGPDVTANGQQDGFVAKVNAAGTALVFAGYVGGDGNDSGRGIAVSSDNEVFLTGTTASTETTFPATIGPDLTYNGGPTDAFVAKLRADGTSFDYAGYIGGDMADAGNGIAVNVAGEAHVAGDTRSTEATFPVARGPDLTHNGVQDAFVAKVGAAGTSLIYAGYVGGDALDAGHAVALDANDNAHLTGDTLSSQATFPVTGGDDRGVFAGVRDAYVAQINPAGSTLTYAGFIGGSDDDRGLGIAIGPDGAAYIAGRTSSTAATFPVTAGPDLVFNGDRDAFIVKIRITGPAITLEGIVNAATFVGGPIAPGEIISIFGVGIGPSPGVDTAFDENGNVPTMFAGVQVLINGVPAPLYYVGENQVNCQAPYEIEGAETVTVQVIFEGAASNIVTIAVAETAPGLFTIESGIGQVIAVLFPSGMLNSADNPVGPGQIVTLYGTGEGQTSPAGETGVPVDVNNLPVPIADVVVTIGGVAQDILYVGGAPGFAGLLQINMEIVAGTPAGAAVPIVVTIGGVGSTGALTPEKGTEGNEPQVTIAIIEDAENQGPAANAQTVMTDEDTPVAITLTGTDPEGDPLTFTITRVPANGVLSGVSPVGPASASVTYTPAADFNGNDSFDFRVMDPNGGQSTATVAIEVKPVPDPPVANNDAVNIEQDTTTVIDVLANDFDPDDDALAITGVGDAQNGVATTDGATVTYEPNNGFVGSDRFDYVISDGDGKGVDTATVIINVRRTPAGGNSTPVANGQSVQTIKNVPLPIVLSGDDPDGDILAFTIVTPPSHGSLGMVVNQTPETASVTYTPDLDFVGPDSFAFEVDDGNGGDSTASVSIAVGSGSADLAITKTPATGMVTAGGTVIYTLTATNNGPGPASGVVVTDMYAAELMFSSDTCGSAAGGVNTRVWNIGTLAADASVSCMMTFGVSADATGTMVNSAVVEGGENDPFMTNNSIATANPVALDVVLSITKALSGPLHLGSEADYVITVNHASGVSNANNVQVVDVLPDELSFVSGTGAGWTCGAVGQTVTCDLAGSIAPAGSSMLTITVMVGN